jgi:hypothetical protein
VTAFVHMGSPISSVITDFKILTGGLHPAVSQKPKVGGLMGRNKVEEAAPCQTISNMYFDNTDSSLRILNSYSQSIQA